MPIQPHSRLAQTIDDDLCKIRNSDSMVLQYDPIDEGLKPYYTRPVNMAASPPSPHLTALQTQAILEPPWSQPGSSENLPVLQDKDDVDSIDNIVSSQLGSSENLPVFQDEDSMDSINNIMSYDPEHTGLPPVDALFKLSKDFPHSLEGAAKMLAIMFSMRDEHLARKRRAKKRIKHVTLQREMWEAELEKAEEEYGWMVKSSGVVTVEHLARKQLAEKATQYVTLRKEMWEAELEAAEKDCGQMIISMGIVIVTLHNRGMPVVMPPLSVSSDEQSDVKEEYD
ncbi:hypothetical protein EW146_g9484 [Bondarzewia mesenterica]|uniref:Uncharacterized protein n=1 Tax=Bondarzewia mesenterica TaxID=1095465 RepID=A0A4S4L645_9AGAM|nr:hypothetical protein EW146_g9484 [Bondarzewia mesenterica]